MRICLDDELLLIVVCQEPTEHTHIFSCEAEEVSRKCQIRQRNGFVHFRQRRAYKHLDILTQHVTH